MVQSTNDTSTLKLLVVIGSTRPGRIGKLVGDWFVARATSVDGIQVDVADLAELDLPMMNEPNHPRLHRYIYEHTLAWSARVAAADAVVLVTPEYNHSFIAPVKNAIDYLNSEWAYKPVGFVSYGGVSGGMRAVLQLRNVLGALRMVPVVDGVLIPMVTSMVTDGVFVPSDAVTASVEPMLDELVKIGTAMRAVRAA